MSRIVGLIQQSDGTQGEKLNAALLAATKGSLQTLAWTQKITHVDSLHLGRTGWQNDAIVQEQDIVLLLDGFIYNDHEFNNKNVSCSGLHYLIDLYRQYGFSGMLTRLNGDFVIVLHDKAKDELFIARDRFGVKPLYYAIKSNDFCFASRCASLFALGISAHPNPTFMGRFVGTHYRYIDNIPEQSPYLNINQLPAAHYLHLKINKFSKTIQLVDIKSWWTINDDPDFSLTEVSELELAEQYKALLLNAVKIRLAKTERPAFTLSGGMDSSSVLASAVHNTGQKFHAFSTLYKDKTYDESNEIQTMLDTTVEEWHPVHIDNPDIFELISRMVSQHDEPVATATWLSHLLLCETVATQGFNSLFGGLGGDELNAGEYEYFFFHFADLKRSGRDALYAYEVEKWCEYHDHPIFKKTPEIAAFGLNHMVDLSNAGRCQPDRSRMFRYAQALNPEFFNETFKPRMDHPFSSYLKNRMYQDLYFETAPCCLRAEDRQATSYGLDNFLPFFDHRLAEFMFRVPGTLKIRDGITKTLLREAMKGILPEETRTRIKKTGWNAPAHRWFSGQGLDKVRDLLSSKKFRERGIYNLSQIKKILSEHEAIVINGDSRENHMMFLWQVVNLELWLSSIEENKL